MIEYSFGAGPVRGGGLPRPRSTTARSPDVPRPAPASGFFGDSESFDRGSPFTGEPESFVGGWDVLSRPPSGVGRSESRDGPRPSAEGARHCPSGRGGNGEATLSYFIKLALGGRGLSGSSFLRRAWAMKPKNGWFSSGYLPFTWLILPVVICLSQRLSHASVSTCRQMAKPRTAH